MTYTKETKELIQRIKDVFRGSFNLCEIRVRVKWMGESAWVQMDAPDLPDFYVNAQHLEALGSIGKILEIGTPPSYGLMVEMWVN